MWSTRLCSLYLVHVTLGLSRRRLAALLHGWRWRGRRGEALSAHSGHLKQWQGGVEVHRDLRGHGVRRRRLQTDGQSSSRALQWVGVVKDIQLRRNDVHHGHWSVARDHLGGRLAFQRIWRGKKTKSRNHKEECVCCLKPITIVHLLTYLHIHRY